MYYEGPVSYFVGFFSASRGIPGKILEIPAAKSRISRSGNPGTIPGLSRRQADPVPFPSRAIPGSRDNTLVKRMAQAQTSNSSNSFFFLYHPCNTILHPTPSHAKHRPIYKPTLRNYPPALPSLHVPSGNVFASLIHQRSLISHMSHVRCTSTSNTINIQLG